MSESVKESMLQKNGSLVVTLLLASPILYTLITMPDTFSMSWNEGRGGFLFALAFVAAELIGLRLPVSNKRIYCIIAMAVITIAYFVLLDFGLRDGIRGAAEAYDVRLVHSWIWMWDFIVMAIFMSAALALAYGKRWIRIAPAAPIYLAGSAIILSLDAFFPYDTLGPLQSVVPYLLQVDSWIINTLDIGHSFAKENVLLLNGKHGSMALQVFWPSAGVHSMIIYTLVMMAFLLKMNIPRKRKLMYFAIGATGTVIVNMIRIFSLSLYALLITTSIAQFEEFHSIAGEIMFLPWLAFYLFLVMHVEGKRARKLQASKSPSGPGPP